MFDDETIYLKPWHTQAPSEHSISGNHAHAEIHLVHADSTGNPRGVVGIPVNPSTKTTSEFFTHFLSAIPAHASTSKVAIEQLKMGDLLNEVGYLKRFWTYKGSLTTSPCTEGIRWWASGKTLEVSYEQMSELLAVSAYWSRRTQMLWGHEIGV